MNYRMMAVLSLIPLVTTAIAKPEPGTDLNSDESHWVQSLIQNYTHTSCCDVADCRKVDYRIDHGQIQALIKNSWIIVPSEKVLRRENPTGFAWACYRQGEGEITSDWIYCFVPLDMF